MRRICSSTIARLAGLAPNALGNVIRTVSSTRPRVGRPTLTAFGSAVLSAERPMRLSIRLMSTANDGAKCDDDTTKRLREIEAWIEVNVQNFSLRKELEHRNIATPTILTLGLLPLSIMLPDTLGLPVGVLGTVLAVEAGRRTFMEMWDRTAVRQRAAEAERNVMRTAALPEKTSFITEVTIKRKEREWLNLLKDRCCEPFLPPYTSLKAFSVVGITPLWWISLSTLAQNNNLLDPTLVAGDHLGSMGVYMLPLFIAMRMHASGKQPWRKDQLDIFGGMKVPTLMLLTQLGMQQCLGHGPEILTYIAAPFVVLSVVGALRLKASPINVGLSMMALRRLAAHPDNKGCVLSYLRSFPGKKD